MFIRAIAFVVFLAPVVLAQQPTPLLPDPNLNPGNTFDVTVRDLCVPGYTKKVRNVPAEMKREVYEEYGVTLHGPGDYEVGHLIPLELGGSNSLKNLWPDSHRTMPWNAQAKDRFEAKLHKLVCNGQLDLKTAQHVINLSHPWSVTIQRAAFSSSFSRTSFIILEIVLLSTLNNSAISV